MFGRLIEFTLPRIIGIMVHKRETLTKKERAAKDAFMAKLDIKKRKTEKSIIVAVIGLVGSGKSSVAHELAKHIGATVIGGDDIRIELRKQSERYEKSRSIAENITLKIVEQGGNVILDSDFVDEKKRASVHEKARKAGIRLIFIRTVCDFDVMSQRIRDNDPGEFFNNASSSSKALDKGKDVKMREALRRLPHHYRHINQGGGQWLLKKFSFPIFAKIDTTDSDSWKREVEKCAKRLITR